LLRVHDGIVVPHDAHMLCHRGKLTHSQAIGSNNASGSKPSLVSAGEGCVRDRLPCGAVARLVELSIGQQTRGLDGTVLRRIHPAKDQDFRSLCMDSGEGGFTMRSSRYQALCRAAGLDAARISYTPWSRWEYTNRRAGLGSRHSCG